MTAAKRKQIAGRAWVLAVLGSPLAFGESPQSEVTIKPGDLNPIEMVRYATATESALPPGGLRLVDQGRTTAILKSSRGFQSVGYQDVDSGPPLVGGVGRESPSAIWKDFIVPGTVQYNGMVEESAKRAKIPSAIQVNQFTTPNIHQAGGIEIRLNDHAFEAKETPDSIPLLPPKVPEPSTAETESQHRGIKTNDKSTDEAQPKTAVLPPELLRPRAKPLMVAPVGEHSAIHIPQITPFESENLPKPREVSQLSEPGSTTPAPQPSAPAPQPRPDPIASMESKGWEKLDNSPMVEELISAPPRLLKVPQPQKVDLALEGPDRSLKSEATRPVGNTKLGDIRLTVDEQRQVPLGDANRVLVENQDLCDAAIVQGNLFLVPKKSGTCRATIWRSSEKNPVWLQLTIDGASVGRTYLRDLQSIQQLVYRTFPDAAIRVSAQGDGLLVSGIVGSRDQAKEIMQLVRGACLCPVKDNLQVQTR